MYTGDLARGNCMRRPNGRYSVLLATICWVGSGCLAAAGQDAAPPRSAQPAPAALAQTASTLPTQPVPAVPTPATSTLPTQPTSALPFPTQPGAPVPPGE